jgi:RNA polymerase-associated protein RTF1
VKPWQKRAAETKASRLDEVDFSDGDQDMADTEEAEQMAGSNAVEADLEDYQKVTLPRRRVGRWCNEPFFKDAVKNCFVKLFVGANEQGKKCYRLCKIVGFETSKNGSYELPPVKKEKPVRLDSLVTPL